jgi:hypothetical protein
MKSRLYLAMILIVYHKKHRRRSTSFIHCINSLLHCGKEEGRDEGAEMRRWAEVGVRGVTARAQNYT